MMVTDNDVNQDIDDYDDGDSSDDDDDENGYGD